jgi:hypothetical protein
VTQLNSKQHIEGDSSASDNSDQVSKTPKSSENQTNGETAKSDPTPLMVYSAAPRSSDDHPSVITTSAKQLESLKFENPAPSPKYPAQSVISGPYVPQSASYFSHYQPPSHHASHHQPAFWPYDLSYKPTDEKHPSLSSHSSSSKYMIENGNLVDNSYNSFTDQSIMRGGLAICPTYLQSPAHHNDEMLHDSLKEDSYVDHYLNLAAPVVASAHELQDFYHNNNNNNIKTVINLNNNNNNAM